MNIIDLKHEYTQYKELHYFVYEEIWHGLGCIIDWEWWQSYEKYG